jgi:hypothetical protein
MRGRFPSYLDVDSPCHDKQRSDEHNETKVLKSCVEHPLRIFQDSKIEEKDNCAESEGDEGVPFFPPMSIDEWNEGNAREEEDKRENHPELGWCLVKVSFSA